ncbi:M1 family metallopeptidase [uncultured Kordia sp.]|uniref:M1 family metallopeptidase n=1 Tax=uncultured Kordia sp. TaxID=507699 RepID=UPI00261A5BD0|nr:M1 family metallopeptidase [uncultured Kordia sp.]
MYSKHIFIFSIIVWLALFAQVGSKNFELDVISYHLTIEPDIGKKYIRGTVVIKFQIETNANTVVFKSGNLSIDKVTGDNVISFKNRNGNVTIKLSDREKKENELTIDYHGNPTTGLLFDSDSEQAFTVYSTSQWMICNDAPGDKALFHLNITVPADQDCIASGELVNRSRKKSKIQYSYQQQYESPTYTYGFAIGNFNLVEEKSGDVLLRYYSREYTNNQLKTIFQETPKIISFFEEKSGVKYYQSTYSQILIGAHYQEMSGYSTLKDSYGKLVLKDSTESNLISHELAHQWWGNRVTCKNWNHFWLNEAMATYMSAAYNQHRFGEKKYQSDIDSYYNVYKAIKKRGNDKPLVFANWSNPTSDDRNLVYFKGAYVLHLLREKLGDEVFWKAIKLYTTKYFGKSVETIDFQNAFEESSGVELDDFFNAWVYKS